MNKAITDGVLLMPPAFADGLDVWSSGDGTSGSDTYLNATNAALVVADQDFGSCLELQKIESTTFVRYMGQTPLLPGCYLRVTARIKAISGNLPEVRIAGYAARGDGSEVTGLTTSGSSTTLTAYGDVVEVSAIIGAGNRGGVDLVWGREPVYGHFGLDLTGANGGIVRIDDIEVEDITSVFLRDIVSTVDVRDFGAVGDGVTDDSDAFDAANAVADGRTILVPAGTFRLETDIAFDHLAKFEGTLSMPVDKMLLLRKNYDLPTYIEAFGDEGLAFRKAFQALLNSSDQVVPQPGGMGAGCLGVLPLGQAIGACAQARNCCTGPAAPSNDTVTAEVWVKAVAVVLNSSPSSTLPNPVSLTVRVAPSVWWRWVEMMLLRGPSKRMEKAGAMGHSFGLVTAMA